jgi:hypothetical protein
MTIKRICAAAALAVAALTVSAPAASADVFVDHSTSSTAIVWPVVAHHETHSVVWVG